MIRGNPTCYIVKCFANENQKCSALDNTFFGARGCPFFKDREVYKNEMGEHETSLATVKEDGEIRNSQQRGENI